MDPKLTPMPYRGGMVDDVRVGSEIDPDIIKISMVFRLWALECAIGRSCHLTVGIVGLPR